MSTSHKEKIIRVLQLFQTTDEKTPMNAVQISQKLEEEYGMENVHRTSIYDDVRLLQSCGYPIKQAENSHKGWYMEKHLLEDWEIKLMLDSVQQARCVSVHEANEIRNKLLNLTSQRGRSRFSHMIMPLPGNVRGVGQIGEYIEIMLEAMYLHKKIRFQYTEINNAMEKVLRKEGKMYQLNLYTIYWSDNNYYLIGSHDNHDGLTNYRLDRMHLIDLFKEMDKKKLTLKMQIRQEYYRVKELLDGKRPSRMDLFTYMDDEIYRICVSGSHAKENPFQHYLDFLYELGELSEDEQELYAGIGRELIQTIETTEMQKVYKMPILYSFYNHGNIRIAVTDEEVLESWKEFFDTGTNWKDFPNVNAYEDYKKVTDKQHLSKAKRMPITRLKMSGKGFFVEKDGYALALRDEIGEDVGNMAFGEQMGDVLGYRSLEYYRRRYEGNRGERK